MVGAGCWAAFATSLVLPQKETRVRTRQRLCYLAGAIVTIGLGLGSRRYGAYLPAVVAQYAGDTLWALLVFLAVSTVMPQAGLPRRGALAFVVAYAIELSQLYHGRWIEMLRQTTLGGLVLGYGFLWSDLVCYGIGILAGMAIDYMLRGRAGFADGEDKAQAHGVL